MREDKNIKSEAAGEMEALHVLAKTYAEYSAKTTKLSDFGARCEDITPRGQKAASTKKYNKFADACEALGVSLREQNEILRRYY